MRNDLPNEKAPNFGARIRETLMTYLGRQGDPLDRGVTLRDLVDNGLATISGAIRPGSTAPLAPVSIELDIPEYTPDLTPPPTPTGLTVTAGIAYLLIRHDNPIFTQGHGYSRTRVYGATRASGAPAPTFSDAVEIAQFSGTTYGYPTNPTTTWHIWVKWDSVDGVSSAAPGGGTNGVSATTGEDVSTLLTALAGEIRETELFSSLGARIDKIDVGPNALVPQVSSLSGKYTVKIDNNGYVSGFGLASSANNATPESEFAIRADRFYVASPSGPGISPIIPFIVRTTPTTVNGKPVPAGVYIDGAYIQGGSIQGTAIANSTIENSALINVSADKITGAALTQTAYIESYAYVPGTSGWKINGNGTAEFAAASIRGQLTAAQIDTRNLTIKDANGNVILGAGTALSLSNIAGLGALATQNSVTAGQVSGLGLFATAPQINASNISTYIAGAAIGTAYIADTLASTNYSPTTGWQINKSGTAYFNEAAIRGSINGGAFTGFVWPTSGTGFHLSASGLALGNGNTGKYFLVEGAGDVYAPQFKIVNGNATFSGDLSAASGTFSGTLTAQAINAVNTINIAGNAVTVPAGANATNVASYVYGPVTALSVSLDTAGGGALVVAEIEIYSSLVGTGETSYYDNVTVALVRSGEVLATEYVASPKATVSFIYYDSNAMTGTRTYALGVSNSNGPGSYGSRSLVVLGTKR